MDLNTKFHHTSKKNQIFSICKNHFLPFCHIKAKYKKLYGLKDYFENQELTSNILTIINATVDSTKGSTSKNSFDDEL